jgi:hypothetical protein
MIRRSMWLAALLPAAGAACTPALHGHGVGTIEGERHVVAWRAPAPLPLAQFFAIDFAVCARDGSAVKTARVDATMPEHGHGMNYRPTVQPRGNGRFRADGLLLHMPGRWQLAFAVGGETLRAALNVD